MKSFKEYLNDNGIGERTLIKYNVIINSFISFANIKSIKDINNDDIIDKAIEFCNNKFKQDRNNDGTITFIKIKGENRSYLQKYALIKWFEYHNLDNLAYQFKKRTKRMMKQLPRRKSEKALTMFEWKKLVKELPKEYSMIVKVMFWGGFRIEETLHIIKGDLKQFDKQIRVSTIGKGKKRLTVFMPTNFSKELLKYVNNKCKTDNSAKLFDISYNTFRKEIKKYGKTILGDSFDITSHGIGKHTRSQFEFDRGTPIHKIKEILHHQSITTTDIYRTQGGFDSKDESNIREGEV